MKQKKEIKAVSRTTPKGKGTPVLKNVMHEVSTPFEIFIKNNTLLVFTGTVFLLIFIVFHKFLLLDETYLFKDSGSDTVNGFWPNFVHLSEYFRNTGFPKWSFNQGIGKNNYPFSIGNPFNVVLYFLPKDDIAYGIIFVEVIKIYLGGLFFFLFLRMIKLTAYTCIIGGVLYSFCGFMILGSSWYLFSTEAFYASMLLYCCEKYLRNGNWYLIPIPFFLFAAFQPFLLYLYGLFITIYSIVRIAVNDGWQWKKMMLTVVRMGALAFLGAIMSSFILISDIDSLLHTPRSFGGEASNLKTMVSAPVFGLTTLFEITSTIYRFFSSDLLGTGSNFNGWFHYIDAPTFYTGLITCLLMPQAFFLMKKRERSIYSGLTILAIIPLIFPFFRHLFWLFSGDYFRTYSLFISMLFLILCLKTLSAMDSKWKINIPVLLITLAVLFILLFYPYYTTKDNIINTFTGTLMVKAVNTSLRTIVVFFLVIYTCLFYFFNNPGFRNFIVPLLAFTILIELAYFSNISVNSRLVISSAELHEKTEYNDYTIDAVAWLNSKDKGFYRITKDYKSGPSYYDWGYNDGLIQNYKGTGSYDSFNQLYYCNFLNALNVYSIEGLNYRKIQPSITRPLLSIILNVKYELTKYKFPGRDARNGVSSLSDSITTTGDVTITRNKLFLPFGYTYQNYISLSEFRKLNNFQKDKMLFRAFVADSVVSLEGLNQLYAKDTVPGTYIDLNELSKYTAALRQDSLSNLFYNQNTVKGNIKLSQTKLLFLTIPYDKGWAFKVDGAIIKPLMPTIGFTGVVLEKGEHTIELNYEPPFLKLGCYISGFGILGYIFLLIRYRKRRF